MNYEFPENHRPDAITKVTLLSVEEEADTEGLPELSIKKRLENDNLVGKATDIYMTLTATVDYF